MPSPKITFATNGKSKMSISSSGNVGIGTTSPGTPFTVGRVDPELDEAIDRITKINNLLKGGLTIEEFPKEYAYRKEMIKQHGPEIIEHINYKTTEEKRLYELVWKL